jgi:hypothetical protein
MGYTQYWYRKLEYKPKTFEKFVEDCKKIIVLARWKYMLADACGEDEPVVTSELIRFNGDFGTNHEPFVFPRVMKKRDYRVTNSDGTLEFMCAKTREQPYDAAVVACLIAAKRHFKNSIIIRSDGGLEKEWLKGIALAQEALGDVSEEIIKIRKDFRKRKV